MAEDQPTSQSPPHNRRSSFAGQTLADLFGSGRSSIPRNTNDNPQQYQGPITTAAAAAQRRRLSLSTLGLSGSPNSTSPYSSLRGRGESISSAGNSSIDESAIEDEPARDGATSSHPGTPFARRMSFGARAMRDIRNSSSGNVNGGGSTVGSPGQNGRYSPASAANTSGGHGRPPSMSAAANNGTASARDFKGRGEGFNWSENLRTRAERGSIAGIGGGGSAGGGVGMSIGTHNHARAKSVATMEPPVQEMPRQAPNKPDHFQERILKGDFYMD